MRDLALFGQAVRGARFRLDNGAAAMPQLAVALWAGERAQAGLVALLQRSDGPAPTRDQEGNRSAERPRSARRPGAHGS